MSDVAKMVTKITLTLLHVTVTFYISLRDHSSEIRLKEMGNEVEGNFSWSLTLH